MKKIATTFKFLLVLSTVFCQENDNYKENIYLNIDRNIYITGEYINFSSYLYVENDNRSIPLSKIIYVELITSDNKQIAESKYRINNSSCNGEIEIPEDINSGYYYLRAYTKSMRSWGPGSYKYLQVKIINPNKEDILNGSSNKNPDLPWTISDNSNPDSTIQIIIDKTEFFTREDVKIKIINSTSIDYSNVSVSIVPKTISDIQSINWNGDLSRTDSYIPETRGVSITGICVDEETNLPLSHKKINLSILEDKKNEFYSVSTKKDGRFFFSLADNYGRKDIFLSTEDISDASPRLLIDNDFCKQNVSLPNPKFKLSLEEQEIAYKLAVNNQIKNRFRTNNKLKEDIEKNIDTIPFYGKPTKTLFIDDYILLPTMEDYFTEIPFLVRLRKIDGKKTLKILGEHPELLIYDPLLMVDLVPINNIEDILAISPQNVSRIEAITSPYVKGDIIYGGIMNIISKKNDLAGIKLPESGIFLNYLFLSPKNNDDNSNIIVSDKTPDARNTLYWNPSLKVNKNSTEVINFTTGDTKTEYQINVFVITADGKSVISTKQFIVK